MKYHPETIEASEELIHDLQRVVSEAAFDRMTRLVYSTDASIYQMMPIGVVFPQNADEVCAVVETAKAHGVPVLPRGGGSSLAGQAVGHAVILDFTKYMGRITDFNPESRVVHVQPGITLGKLNREIGGAGLTFGPDPASGDRATIGGIVGNNSTGAHSIVYGMTHDHTLAVNAVLSDASKVRFDGFEGRWDFRAKRSGLEGAIYNAVPTILEQYGDEIASRYPNTFRHVSGYNLNLLAGNKNPNLASLIVGSEGTLGIVTEATLNLVPVPKVKRLAMVHFSEMRAAMESVPKILESEPTAVEVLDKMLLDLTRDRPEFQRRLSFVQGDPAVVLLVEYSGETESELDAGLQRLKVILSQLNYRDHVVVISDKTQQANVWYVRKLGLGILMSVRGDAKPIPFIEDAAVPVAHLADYVTQIYDFANSVGVEKVAMYAHASAGCIHIRPLVNLKSAGGVRQLRQIAEKSIELTTLYGGTLSGEHGDGLVRGEFLETLFGTKMMAAFGDVKQAFDPDGLMNPGKVVNTPRMDDERLLRFGSDYAVPFAPVKTKFDFGSDGGFAPAVEMCNGAGVCRKLEQGVMCPSFQATRDETHSTRGRANALRSAMMGLLGPDGMTSPELYDVFDLCLSCHACQSECPSAVDMAKLKAEFLHQYYQTHPSSIRTWVFANIGSLNKVGQPLAPLANWVLGGPGKWALTALGIHENRAMPKFAKQTFSRWHQGRHSNGNMGKQVVFFHDTFMEHNDPHIGQAAIKVLEAAGYQPIVIYQKVDSGRPAVSKGLLHTAERLAKTNIALLAPYAKRGIDIVGCEPSSMVMLKQEYVDLVPGEDAKIVADQTMMLDQFLVQEYEAGNLVLNLDDTPRQVLFHGHCQQKAAFGTESVHQMLAMIPNCEVDEIEAGCCGMAGSFGYEAEHYDISINIAELGVAPAVRAAEKETIVCAMGTSCRDQIGHTAKRESVHPIEVLAGAIKST